MLRTLRLGVNIDHVATLRNARGGVHPCPVKAAQIAKEAGADGITAHLREDRRHIRDADIERLAKEVKLPLNFEMAATDEMQKLALRIRPNAVCIVPEKRTEVTTEGGLNVAGNLDALRIFIAPLRAAGIHVSLFIDPAAEQVKASVIAGADIVELHTGRYCETIGDERKKELAALQQEAKHAVSLGLECHAGHGLSFDTVKPVAAIPEVMELNIGHFLIGEAVFLGLGESVMLMKKLMMEARK